MRANRPAVAVVGGGITGLAAAWRLTELLPSARVVVLESTAAPGGKLRLGELAGITLDLGAESVLARRPEGVDLIRAAGLGDDLVHPRATEAAVVSRGRLYPMPAGTLMGVPGDPGLLRGLLSEAELDRVRADEPGEPLGADVDVASWVAARVGWAVVDRLVEPLLGGVYAGQASRLSLQATLPQLWEIARRGGRLLPAVRAALPAAGDRAGPVFAGIRGGVGRLPRALASGLAGRGVELRTATTVRELGRTAAGWTLSAGPATRSATAVPAAHPRVELSADAVLLAVAPPAAARLLAGVSPAAAAEYAAIEMASVALITVLVPAEQLADQGSSGLLVPPMEGRAVKAATFSSAKWAWTAAATGNLAAVRMSLGRAGEARALQRGDRELCRLAVADLAGILGRPLTPVAWTVTRWGGGLPQYAVGHVARVARIRSAVAAAGGGLAVAGAALDGVGIPACIASADLAARQVRDHLTARPAEPAGRMPG